MRRIDSARPGFKEHSDRKTAIPGFKENSQRLCEFAGINIGVRLDEAIVIDRYRAQGVFNVFVDQYRVDDMT